MLLNNGKAHSPSVGCVCLCVVISARLPGFSALTDSCTAHCHADVLFLHLLMLPMRIQLPPIKRLLSIVWVYPSLLHLKSRCQWGEGSWHTMLHQCYITSRQDSFACPLSTPQECRGSKKSGDLEPLLPTWTVVICNVLSLHLQCAHLRCSLILDVLLDLLINGACAWCSLPTSTVHWSLCPHHLCCAVRTNRAHFHRL